MPSSSVPIQSLPLAASKRLREISRREHAREFPAANFRHSQCRSRVDGASPSSASEST